MSLNNFHRIISIILIAIPYLYGQVQDDTATKPPPESTFETATDDQDQQDLERQVVNEESIVYTIPTFDKMSGFIVGWSFNQPINSGAKYKLEKYEPIIGLSITSPITISARMFTVGFGLGVEAGNDSFGIYGTTNVKLFGKFSLMAGLGSINGSGLHLGGGFDINVPNLPFSVRPFVRANSPSQGWVQAGIIFGYRL